MQSIPYADWIEAIETRLAGPQSQYQRELDLLRVALYRARLAADAVESWAHEEVVLKHRQREAAYLANVTGEAAAWSRRKAQEDLPHFASALADVRTKRAAAERALRALVPTWRAGDSVAIAMINLERATRDAEMAAGERERSRAQGDGPA